MLLKENQMYVDLIYRNFRYINCNLGISLIGNIKTTTIITMAKANLKTSGN